MIATLLSESHGDSGRRVAAIIDGYLPRVGHRAWMGHISQEGLDDLRLALRKRASRATAVACHVVHGGKARQLAWIVGRRSAFGPDGSVAVATTRRGRPADPLPGLSPLLAPLVGLAAAFHDLGKLSEGFAAVLLASVQCKQLPQPVRHELVSLMLVQEMLARSGAQDDRGALTALLDPSQVSALILAAWDGIKRHDGWLRHSPREDGQPLADLLPDGRRFPFLRGVADLVVNHHRLPRGLVDRDTVMVTDGEHVSRWDAATVGRVPAHLKLSAPGRRELDAGSWARTVAYDARRAVQALDAAPIGDPAAWTALVATMARTALMLGDHDASAQKQPFTGDDGDPKALSQGHAFANTTVPVASMPVLDVEDWDDMAAQRPRSALATPTGRVFADTWWVHTRKVRQCSLAMLAAFANLGRRLPAVAEGEQPAGLRATAAPGSPFAWQDLAVEAMAEAVKPVPDGAALVFLLAGTGRGKTLAAMRVAAVGRRRLRVNCALGLRSLTLQTGDEYLGRIGFRPDQAISMIGSDLLRRLHEADRQREKAEAMQREKGDSAPKLRPEPLVTDGTDAEDLPEPDLSLGYDDPEPLPAPIERACDGKPRVRRMLAAPVLVSTLDLLMAAADPRGSRHLLANLRVATADLVLDEIDAYEPEDMVAICRLVELAAMAGRRVIAASATLSPMLAAAMRMAYAAGRRLRAGMVGGSPAFAVAWLSEHAQDSMLDTAGQEEAAFLAHHHGYAGLLTDALVQGEVRRRTFTLDIGDLSSRLAINRTVAMAAIGLHTANRVVDPVTSRGVSVGLVRWNRTHSCRSFAAHLLDEGMPGVRLAVLCTHARFPLAVRHHTDVVLRHMLTRKPGPDGQDPVLDHPRVRQLLDDGSKGDVLILVSATPLLELGRDLDFDYAIVEPASVGSVIQTAGRVRRHRPGAWQPVNIGVLSHSSDVLLARGKFDRHIQWPGVESPLPYYQSATESLLLQRRAASDMFDLMTWQRGLDARDALLPRSAAGELNERRRARLLTGSGNVGSRRGGGTGAVDRTATTLAYANFAASPLRLLDGLHPAERRFRRRTGEERNYVRQDGRWMVQNPNARDEHLYEVEDSMRRDWRPVADDWESRLLLPTSVFDADNAACELGRALARAGMQQSRFDERELTGLSIVFRGDAAKLVLYYHPVLGADRIAI